MRIKDAKIVITGASFGLGKVLAIKLSQLGAELYLLSRSITKVSFSFPAHKITCDVRDPQAVKNVFEKLPNFNVLINCVGIPLVKPLVESTPDEIQNVIQTNLTGLIHTCKFAIPKLKNSSTPFIINIISTSGKKARPNETVYCASKWGLAGFTNSLRLELASRGINVTGIYPGGMKSEHFWQGIKTKEEIKHYLDPQEVAEYIIHLLRLAQKSLPAELVIERKSPKS